MKLRAICLGVLPLILAPQAAQAHLVATDMGPIYDGVMHFALSPEDFLPVIALALFAGLKGPACSRLLLAATPIAWFMGGVAGSLNISPPTVTLSIATAIILVFIGGLLAANLKLPPILCTIPAVALGLVRGAADLLGVPATGGFTLPLLGMSACVFTVFALAASISLPLRQFWVIVATRVTGSWLAAVGLLLAGWIIRYGDKVG